MVRVHNQIEPKKETSHEVLTKGEFGCEWIPATPGQSIYAGYPIGLA